MQKRRASRSFQGLPTALCSKKSDGLSSFSSCPPPKTKNGHAREEEDMTVSYFQTRHSGRRRVCVSSQTSRGRRCAWPAVYSVPPGRSWVVPKLVIKRRHPGGGGCRHLIKDPKPREEVKRWVVSRSAIFWEEQADPNSCATRRMPRGKQFP
jgi:hypothetical protein